MDSYHKTMFGFNKDVLHYHKNYLEQARKKREAQRLRTLYMEIFLAVRYWAFEAIERVAFIFATYHDPKSLRMLSWSSNKVPSAKKLVELFYCTDISNFCNYVDNFFIYYMKSNFNFFIVYSSYTISVNSTGRRKRNI